MTAAPAASTITYYLDTSIAIHALSGTPAAVRWFDRVTDDDDAVLVSSRLLRTEIIRVLRREGHPVTEVDLIVDHVATLPITESVLTTAELIAEHVKTLDALHVASALLIGSDTIVATSDSGLQRVAEAVGLRWVNPLAQVPPV